MVSNKGTKKLKRKENNGFTLVEVIVVIVILAVLAAILIPTLIGYIEKGKEKAAIANCRAAVTAGQTLSSEYYGTNKNVSRENIMELAEIDGQIGNLFFNEKFEEDGTLIRPDMASSRNGTITHLTYVDLTSESLTSDPGGSHYSIDYCRNPDSCSRHDKTYTASKASTEVWVKDKSYVIGDTLAEGGYLFTCMATHTSGSRSNTRNPTVKSNKGTWEVIGTDDGSIPQYNATVRFAVGLTVQYNGNLYQRTTFNLTGGQTPYSNSSSRYWTLVGSAPEE